MSKLLNTPNVITRVSLSSTRNLNCWIWGEKRTDAFVKLLK